ncbi:hypothetical protein B0O99DRAFT_38236 [Bisporella sp. PMI_857]|nr:hypothetical protein B0O99DRAFT_38236 [Bisporella sp. PMI_857]
MPTTLRRSCAACAKAKHKCSLQTPKCARCTSRNIGCVYANEPLASISMAGSAELPLTVGGGAFDPFGIYPTTALPRTRVQILIQHFLTKIAFEYYPHDPNPVSNPFITSWWPLALNDPALFHVSLSTACFDIEFRAQKGFLHSEILMRDAVSLIRGKIEDPVLAFQDSTMNAVITMAAIEHGKGNLEISTMHVDAVKRMVEIRGGISKVKETSLLTARMVPWVAMLVTGMPQFKTQDYLSQGTAPISQWELVSLGTLQEVDSCLATLIPNLDIDIQNVLLRLRTLFHEGSQTTTSLGPCLLQTTAVHDLAALVIHDLLPSPYVPNDLPSISEAVRYALCIYMFILHGPTYYSHTAILHALILKLHSHLDALSFKDSDLLALKFWLLSMGLVGSIGFMVHEKFANQASILSAATEIKRWNQVKAALMTILWLDHPSELSFLQAWTRILTLNQSSTLCSGVTFKGTND